MNLETSYMGLSLKNPIVASACPLTKELDSIKIMEESGVSAIVMPSLFEEEISYEQEKLEHFLGFTEGVSFEASDFFPDAFEYKNYSGEEYLESIVRIKRETSFPVISSLNGRTSGGWLKYAKQMQEAGADALELNIYDIPTDPMISGAEVEAKYIEIVSAVKKEIDLPVGVKISPFFSSFANMAKKMEEAGADGIVMFNRFLEPDYDLENFEPHLRLDFSTRYEMRLPLHWLAILYGELNCSMAATRGIKSGVDVIKMIMAGADCTMIASLFYQQGVDKAEDLLNEMIDWMDQNEFESIKQLKGSMSYKRVTDKSAFERSNYMKQLRSFY